MALDNGHLHGALASSVSSRPVFASGATTVPFSAAASLPFTALAPLFTLLSVFVSAPASSLPGAWTSAPAPTSPFPEVVLPQKQNFGIHCRLSSCLRFRSHEVVEKKNPGALTSYFGHRAR